MDAIARNVDSSLTLFWSIVEAILRLLWHILALLKRKFRLFFREPYYSVFEGHSARYTSYLHFGSRAEAENFVGNRSLCEMAKKYAL